MQKQWKWEWKWRENENVLKIQPETELLLYLNFGFVRNHSLNLPPHQSQPHWYIWLIKWHSYPFLFHHFLFPHPPTIIGISIDNHRQLTAIPEAEHNCKIVYVT